MVKSSEWSIGVIYHHYVNLGRLMFLLTEEHAVLNKTFSQNHSDYSGCSIPPTCDAILATIIFIMASCYQMQRVFITIAFGLCSFTIWVATKDFHNALKSLMENSDANSPSKVMAEKFGELREVADLTNDIWQSICFWHIMDSILWLSMDLDVTVKTTDLFLKVHISYLLCFSAVTVILSAESDRKVIISRVML